MALMLPSEFEQRMKTLLGDEWNDFLEGYSDDKYQALRLNPLKLSGSEDEKEFSEEFVSALFKSLGDTQTGQARVSWAKDAYYYEEPLRPGKHPYHEMGLYYIQEPSAMSAAALLAPEPGIRVLDLCAAPGGKTTQLASYLGQEGLLVANEINPSRARILSGNVERLGIANCLVTNEDSFTMADHFPAFFHAILVDAPCSGEGMFRKNPEAIQEWSPANVRLCAARQAEILDNAASMLLPGGRLVYSTCTFAPEENEMSMAAFLLRHPDFHILQTDAPYFSKARPDWIDWETLSQTEGYGVDMPEEERRTQIEGEIALTFRLWPHKLHGEGHYAAVLVRDGKLSSQKSESEERKDFASVLRSMAAGPVITPETGTSAKGKKNKSASAKSKRSRGSDHGLSPEQSQQLFDFANQTLKAPFAQGLLAGNFTLFGDQLYMLPRECPSLNGLHVMRAGLQIGEFKKNRFEPSHALGLALTADMVTASTELKVTDSRSFAYFNGEGFALTEEDFPDQKMPKGGWILVCVDGISAGWGKLANGNLKNHYPKGLRKVL